MHLVTHFVSVCCNWTKGILEFFCKRRLPWHILASSNRFDSKFNPNPRTMSIKVNARQTLQEIGTHAGQYRYVMQTELYNRLNATNMLKEAALRSGIPQGSMTACWQAIGDVIKAWVTVPSTCSQRHFVSLSYLHVTLSHWDCLAFLFCCCTLLLLGDETVIFSPVTCPRTNVNPYNISALQRL